MNRPTIRDIARVAGVSPGAASFALNDQAGVSEETRRRVKRVARELGWTPNVAARALSVRQARAVGLVIARPEESFTGERFFMQLIAGIERVLTASSRSLVLQFVSGVQQETECYQRWWSERRVDGVILTDPRLEDPRPALVTDLGLPAVLVGVQQHSVLPEVRVDDGTAMARLVDHFADLGHTRLAHVSGSTELVHTRRRVAAFSRRCAEREVAVVSTGPTDFSEESGRARTTSLISGSGQSAPPTGIIYDNEVLTMGGLVAILGASLLVPEDLAIASFEDTPLCRIVRPQITALRRDPAELGAHATTLLLDVLDGREVDELDEPVMELMVRGSTDPGAR